MRGKYKKKLNHMTSSGDPKKNDGTTVPKSNNSAQERQDVLAVYMISSKSNPTKLQDSESGKQPDNPKPWWRFIPGWRIFEGIGIAAGIAYAVVTIIQWNDLRHNFKADERAWVAAVDTLAPPDFPKIEIGNTAPSAKWLENFGKTPGIQVTHKLEERIFCSGFPDNPPYSDHAAPQGKKAYGPSAGPLWPSQKIQITYAALDHPITEQEWDRLKSGDCLLFLYGTVNYYDIFGESHYQHFCNLWYPVTPHNFVACMSYNDSD